MAGAAAGGLPRRHLLHQMREGIGKVKIRLRRWNAEPIPHRRSTRTCLGVRRPTRSWLCVSTIWRDIPRHAGAPTSSTRLPDACSGQPPGFPRRLAAVTSAMEVSCPFPDLSPILRTAQRPLRRMPLRHLFHRLRECLTEVKTSWRMCELPGRSKIRSGSPMGSCAGQPQNSQGRSSSPAAPVPRDPSTPGQYQPLTLR